MCYPGQMLTRTEHTVLLGLRLDQAIPISILVARTGVTRHSLYRPLYRLRDLGFAECPHGGWKLTHNGTEVQEMASREGFEVRKIGATTRRWSRLDVHVFGAVRDHGGFHVARLATEVGCTRAGLYRAAGKLVAMGLIEADERHLPGYWTGNITARGNSLIPMIK